MKLSNVVKTKSGYVLIDTCSLDNEIGNMMDLMGFGNSDAIGTNFETMVFECNKKGEVENWGELEKKNYMLEKQAIKGHNKIMKKYKLN